MRSNRSPYSSISQSAPSVTGSPAPPRQASDDAWPSPGVWPCVCAAACVAVLVLGRAPAMPGPQPRVPAADAAEPAPRARGVGQDEHDVIVRPEIDPLRGGRRGGLLGPQVRLTGVGRLVDRDAVEHVPGRV